MTKRANLLGKKFGGLVVQSFVGIDKRRLSVWACMCDCGKLRNISNHNLSNGSTRSCGCLLNRRRAENLEKGRNAYKERKYKFKRSVHASVANLFIDEALDELVKE